MRSDRVVVPPEKSVTRNEFPSRTAWELIAWLGALFVLMGAADITLGFYPPAFGNVEWEFGVISGSLNGLAIPAMGSYLLLASAIARAKHTLARLVSAGMFVVVVLLVGLGVLYLMSAPVAIGAVSQSEVVLLGIKKAILKAGLLFIAYLTLFLVGGMKGWKAGSLR